MAKIYIAASFLRLHDARALRLRLVAAGHLVVSRWHEQAIDPCVYMHSENMMRTFAEEDFADLMPADTVVCLTGDAPDKKSRGAKHSEFGVGAGTGKRLILLGPREQLFHWLPAVRIAHDEKELLEILA